MDVPTPPKVSTPERIAWLVWVLILIIILGKSVVRPHSHSVYPIFSRAAGQWLAGEDLYQLVNHPYRYSPLVAVLLIPFSVLPDAVGGMLWRLLSVAVYLGAFAWWLNRGLPRRLSKSQKALLFLLIVPLSIGSLNNGQSNVLVLGLMLAGVTAVSEKRWTLSALCIALATLFKIYPISLGLLLCLTHWRVFAWRFAAMLLAGLALPFLLQHPDYVAQQYRDWVFQLQYDNRQSYPLEYWYRDLRLLCRVCQMPLSPMMYAALQAGGALALATFALAARLANWPERRLLTALFGLVCCWMTLLGSATESCTYMLLAPTLAWGLVEAFVEPHGRALRVGVGLSFFMFLLTQMAVWTGMGRQFHALGTHALAALMLTSCLIAMQLGRNLSVFANQVRPRASSR